MTDEYPSQLVMTGEQFYAYVQSCPTEWIAGYPEEYPIVDVYEGATINITNFRTRSGYTDFSTQYRMYDPNGSDDNITLLNTKLNPIGLSYSNENTGSSNEYALRGTLKFVGEVQPGYSEYLVLLGVLKAKYLSESYEAFILRVHSYPTPVSFDVTITGTGSECYPIQLTVGETTITYTLPSASHTYRAVNLQPGSTLVLSVNLPLLEIVPGEGYADYNGVSFNATATPQIFSKWITPEGEFTESTITIQVSQRLESGGIVAQLADAVRLHYLIDSSDVQIPLPIGLTLEEQDALVPANNAGSGVTTTQLPTVDTNIDGYALNYWLYDVPLVGKQNGIPGKLTRIYRDSETGVDYDGIIFPGICTLSAVMVVAIPDDSAFMIIMDPAGGLLQPGSTPNISVSGYSSHTVHDVGRNTIVWWVDNAQVSNVTEMEVNFVGAPLTEAQGLVPPHGIEKADAWSISAPFFISETDNQNFTVKLERASSDSICQRTMYPNWVPLRDGTGQRALLTAPGYGAIDLGNIQGVSEMYTSDVKQTPIVVYGFRKAFCIDIGVKKNITIKYIRTMPQEVDDDSGDSRAWSNAKWISRLKDVMDRWQMRTNGNRLYVLRPHVERQGESETDPMSQYIDEIDGENCYITSLPIRYDQNPYAISGSIELAVGTLYAQQYEPPRQTVVYIDDNSGTNIPVIRQYAGRSISLPQAYTLFQGEGVTPYFDDDTWHFTGRYFTGWTWTDGSGNTHTNDFGDVIDLTRVARAQDGRAYIHVIAEDVGDAAGEILFGTASSKNVTVYGPPGGLVRMCLGAVGAGGGGGGGSITNKRYAAAVGDDEYYYFYTGGGGGASGLYQEINQYFQLDGNGELSLSFVIGAGGTGGNGRERYDAPSAPGETGDTTYILFNGTAICSGGGGGGGEGGSHSWEPGKVAYGGGKDENQDVIGGQNGLCAGGNGGNKGADAQPGNALSPAWTGVGAGGAAGVFSVHVDGGGGGAGGYYLSGMENYSINGIPFASGGYGGYGGGSHNSPYFTPARAGSYGAGGGGGGGSAPSPGDATAGNGANGGDGWAYYYIISGGQLTPLNGGSS